jgi:2-keto-4-pentenoate hydratase
MAAAGWAARFSGTGFLSLALCSATPATPPAARAGTLASFGRVVVGGDVVAGGSTIVATQGAINVDFVGG